MPIEQCQRCIGIPACGNQVVPECLPVPYFGDITYNNLKVVTIGLNPALDEFYLYNGDIKNRSLRLPLLSDFGAAERANLSDADIGDAKRRRDTYFRDHSRDWHPYFEKMDSVLIRANPAWSYARGTAAHLDLVACATKERWGRLQPVTKTVLIGNCREHFLATMGQLPNGTILLFDGPRAMQEIQSLGLRVENQPVQLINMRMPGTGDAGWRGTVYLGDREYPYRGWSSQVSRLSMLWRCDLAHWLQGSFQNLNPPAD